MGCSHYLCFDSFQAKEELLIKLSISGCAISSQLFFFYLQSSLCRFKENCLLICLLSFIFSELLSSNCSLISLIPLFLLLFWLGIYFCWFIIHSVQNKHSLFHDVIPSSLLNKNNFLLHCPIPRLLKRERLDCLKVLLLVSGDYPGTKEKGRL